MQTESQRTERRGTESRGTESRVFETRSVDERNRWLFLFQGVVAAFLGLGLLMMPGPTLLAVIMGLGAYWVIRGVATLVYMAGNRDEWGWTLFVGLLSIGAGAMAIAIPTVTGTMLFGVFIMVIGGLAILTGITEMYYGLSSHRLSLFLLGVVSLFLGSVLIAHPWIGMAALMAFVGAVSLVGGVVTIAAALRGARDPIHHAERV